MRLSSRVRNINAGGSDGWDVFYRARQLKAAGVPVIELTIGEHDTRTAADILDAMHRSARGGHTGYAEVPGIKGLRDKVAERIRIRSGVETTRDNVLITAGGQAALFAAHLACCDPGDRALFIDPYYVTYPGTIRSGGALPVPVKARPENGFQPLAADIDAVAGGAKSLLINTPNNPAGVIYARETLDNIAAVVKTHDMWLISDEVYDSQIWQGTHLSPRALPGMADRTLAIGSMSKSHAMTGSRLGWIIGPRDAITVLADLATNTNYGVAGFIQDAALYALNQGDAAETAVAAPFRRRRDKALKILSGQTAVKPVHPDGAMYLLLDIRATGLSGDGFANRLLDAHHIAVMPGESFGQAAAGHVRVAMTVADDIFCDALETLVAFARDLARQAAA
ncbi:Arginine--pyruvate transaminase AruH [Thalassovita gelatinovora]|uniref:Aminotransferase n=1 Tax=Thalassovita gelatinovora TaxID=53501 RepID=A0A0P1F5D8_THAGE|nr:aminotransferase class I/II-fold pyridoxal phosphate-dependent enzyme [Thalassovita gelatinovora]QIZ79518.1 aminotransferase class I/II-fold pyridoxal phosphate-dependent enzyme [Thalassovita gelatinovora]CUH62955.1 Arginine--pyruvate transaminase AruH [Thalassovita gelatinovora]SEQ13057.1 arginine:pyruvate transaminase [Thalassovita gelatinovora]